MPNLNQEIDKSIKSRYKTLIKRCNWINIPEYDIFHSFVIESINNGFICYYCGRKLKIKNIYPEKSYNTYSIDHKIPITREGTHDISNLCVCCTLCNITKATMTENEFKKFMSTFSSPEFEKFMIHAYNGQLAKKIERG